MFRGKVGAAAGIPTADQVILAGLMKTPIYAIYNTHDQVYDCPPDDQVTVTDALGRTYTGSGAQLTNQRLTEAVAAASPEYRAVSRVHEVCVGRNTKEPLPCSVHIPTIFAVDDPEGSGGDRYRGGEDYNAVIMDWVRARLQDPLPTLATSR